MKYFSNVYLSFTLRLFRREESPSKPGPEVAPKPSSKQLKAKSESILYSQPMSPTDQTQSPYFSSQSDQERPDGQRVGGHERTSQRYEWCLCENSCRRF